MAHQHLFIQPERLAFDYSSSFVPAEHFHIDFMSTCCHTDENFIYKFDRIKDLVTHRHRHTLTHNRHTQTQTDTQTPTQHTHTRKLLTGGGGGSVPEMK